MIRFVLAIGLLLSALLVGPAGAAPTGEAPAYEDVANSVSDILSQPTRLPLPIERVRAALKQHYIANNGSIYWVGTGRMTPFLQRISNAAYDGLNPNDYPSEALDRKSVV